MESLIVFILIVAAMLAAVICEAISIAVTTIDERRCNRPQVWAYGLLDTTIALAGVSLIAGATAMLISEEGGALEAAFAVALILCGIAAEVWASRGSSRAVGLSEAEDFDIWASVDAQHALRQEVTN